MEILAAAGAGGLDLSPVVDGLLAFIPVVLTALGAVFVAALGLMGFKWAAPQVAGFFKKNAK
jgi:hypothetical protein